MAVQFIYNQEQAVKGGQSQFINETGAYIGKITQAKYVTTQGGAKAMEFAIETDDGLQGNYLSVYYQDKSGQAIASGHNMIQAIMGVTKVQELNIVHKNDADIAPELIDKRIGLFLQKELFLKQDGSESYRLQIICPFSANNQKTLSEHLNGEPATRIQWLIEHSKDKDSRNKQPTQTAQQGYASTTQYYQSTQQGYGNTPHPAPADNFDDDIPF